MWNCFRRCTCLVSAATLWDPIKFVQTTTLDDWSDQTSRPGPVQAHSEEVVCAKATSAACRLTRWRAVATRDM